MIKKYLSIALFFFTQLAYTQSTDSKVEDISYCVGFVNAGHVYNYETEVLTENQLRDALHISTLALELAIASKGRNHYLSNVDYYNAMVEEGVDIAYEEFENETFDWESQGVLDLCQVQLFEYVAQPPESAFWAGDFEFFREISRDSADASVDFIVEYLENN